MGIVSASFPPLGCGNGNLNWNDVRPLIERYLSKINIQIYVHSLHVGDEFVPEHVTASAAPTTLQEFQLDLGSSLHENKGTFFTGESGQSFSVQMRENELGIIRGGRQRERIPLEEIENVWVILRDGILSVDKFSDEASRRYKSYLFPILKSLPYVRSTRISRTGQEGTTKSEALFFVRQPKKSQDACAGEFKQECLLL
jgi:hypothetical protein